MSEGSKKRVKASRKRESGFTLVEVLIVATVISILSTVSLVTFLNALDRGRQRATMADMRSIARAVEAYSVDQGFLPDDSGGLVALQDHLVPYAINVLPCEDHWGNEYSYSADGITNYTIVSHGKDGVDGDDYTENAVEPMKADLVLSNGLFSAAPM